MDHGNMIVAHFATNEIGAPTDQELYGIEIEAEEFNPLFRGPEGSALSRYWNVKEDGSLRNFGVEFVSKLLPPDKVSNAVHHLYGRTRKLWEPSIRSGIHIHANMLGRTLDEVRRVLAYYSFVEPLLFAYVGPEREENIYCVPYYRAPGEAHTLMTALTQSEYGLRDACKYSALFVGPLRTFGTIEFRHAPTFSDPDRLIEWWKLCSAVANSWKLPDPFEVYAKGGVEAVVRAVFSDIWDLDGLPYAQIEEFIRGSGAEEVAFIFQPCTYNQVEWGAPGSFYVNRGQTEDRWYESPQDVLALGDGEYDEEQQQSDDSDEEEA